MLPLQVFGNFFELADAVIRSAGAFTNGMFQTVVDVVMHQGLFSTADRFLHGLQLLRDIQAAAPIFQHGEDAFEVAMSPFEPFNDIGVGGMCWHSATYPIPLDRILQARLNDAKVRRLIYGIASVDSSNSRSCIENVLAR